ncbi:hypothetical protein [Shimazuella alba]|uniref:Uncharacterized protein n=1 Tax=Shimazuella alba TaxID=2690964 RepID=A0A6I4VYS3_9BACL|nr:hypothetical protein [Shimazuella alba]MXQ56013.1 hypothetical protein [Shimazuella alba]
MQVDVSRLPGENNFQLRFGVPGDRTKGKSYSLYGATYNPALRMFTPSSTKRSMRLEDEERKHKKFLNCITIFVEDGEENAATTALSHEEESVAMVLGAAFDQTLVLGYKLADSLPLRWTQ